MTVHIGLDIGGTKTDVVATAPDGTVLHQHRLATGWGATAVMATALEAVTRVCDDASIGVSEAASVGVGIPGAISDGVVSHAVNLGIERLDLASELATQLGVTPVVDNDVNAAAVGAWMLTPDRHSSMAYLNLGTGLAAGIIVDGRVWRGARGAAGEIGHISVDPKGPLDMDGLHGGLETYASGSGVVRQSGRADSSAADILLADEGDDESAAIRERLYFGVANAVRVLILTVDVEEVVIGGGLAGLGNGLLAGTRGILAGWAERSAFLKSVELDQRIRILDTDKPVAAIGAAMRGAGHG